MYDVTCIMRQVQVARVLCKDETKNQVRQVELLRRMWCLDCVIRGIASILGVMIVAGHQRSNDLTLLCHAQGFDLRLNQFPIKTRATYDDLFD